MGSYVPRTKPDHSVTGMPGGVPYIVGNEAAERFSFYGMRAILTIFMTKYLVDASGNDATMGEEQAKSVYHLFVAAAYFTPMLGALISDIFWGKYRTILVISLMYCVGHGLLALMDLGPVLGEAGYGGWDMKPFLFSGLFLIALGAGGIKPCVSAHVGDQFGRGNKHLMTQVFNWFYFSINTGAAASQLLTPLLLDMYGPALAFGLPGFLMAVATFVFWLGRKQFIHVPPAGWQSFKNETLSPDGRRAIKNLSPLFLLFVPMFWAIFDQTGGAWVIQADQMNRSFLGVNWLPSQIQFINPVMILIGIPIFTYGLYPLMGKFFTVTPLRKIGIGLVLTACSFFVSALVEQPIQDKQAEISVRLYDELADDIASLEPIGAEAGAGGAGGARPDAARDETADASGREARQRATLIKAALSASDEAAWEPSRTAALTGVSPVEVWEGLGEDSRDALLGPREEAALEAGFAAAADADAPDAEAFYEAGLALSVLAREVEDTRLARLFPPDAVAELVRALSTSTTEPDDEGEGGGEAVSDLAHAVKLAREVWVEQEGGSYRPDEDRIISDYLDVMPNIGWQFFAYLVLTSGEIMVSIVCLEFAYSQSPRKMKSLIMGVYFLGVSLGNAFVSIVNAVIGSVQKATGVNPLEGASYYWFFGGLMLLTALIYMVWAPFYKGETFIQGEDEEDLIDAQAEAEGTEPR